MQGTNLLPFFGELIFTLVLLSYYLCDLFLYFNATYVLLIIACDSVTTPHFVN